MYLCVLSSTPDDNDPPYDPSAHMNGFRWKHYLVNPRNIELQIRNLVNEGVNVFLNLCDGTPDDPLSGIGLVKTMEKLGVAFTGADSKFFDPTRDQMKAAAKRCSVPVPNWMFANSANDIEKIVKRLRFPILVKPPHGYSSIGLTRNSRVENTEQLKIQLDTVIREYDLALVEEFIEGREFTCLISENPDDPANPITFKPVEFIFPEGESFKHYDMKWVDYNRMSVKAVEDRRIERVLRDHTYNLFKSLNGNGYARCDFRMDASGAVYMLEINPNCGIFYPPSEPGSADFCLMNDPINHSKFLKLMIRAAQKRQARMLAEKMLKRPLKKRPIEVEEPVYA
jgi:D-alanine-D-alanine ligase